MDSALLRTINFLKSTVPAGRTAGSVEPSQNSFGQTYIDLHTMKKLYLCGEADLLLKTGVSHSA